MQAERKREIKAAVSACLFGNQAPELPEPMLLDVFIDCVDHIESFRLTLNEAKDQMACGGECRTAQRWTRAGRIIPLRLLDGRFN